MRDGDEERTGGSRLLAASAATLQADRPAEVTAVPTAVSAQHAPHLLYRSSSPFWLDQIRSHKNRFNSTLSVERRVSWRQTVLFQFPSGKWGLQECNSTHYYVLYYQSLRLRVWFFWNLNIHSITVMTRYAAFICFWDCNCIVHIIPFNY